MSFLYQSGERLNLLARAAAVKAPTTDGGTIDSAFPISGLYDGRPSVYTRYSVLSANSTVTFDLNLLQGGDGEQALDSSWTPYSDTGTPTISQSATSPYAGSNSIRIQLTVASGSHYAGTRRDVYFRAGEKLRLYHAGIVAAGTNVKVIVQDLETGLYLTSGGAWSATPQAAATHTTGGWTDGYVTFAVPDAETGGGLWQRLRISLEGSVASGTDVDVRVEAKIVPGWDTIVVLGHTMTPFVPLGFAYQALSGNNPGDAFSSLSDVGNWLKATDGAPYNPIPPTEWDQQAVWNKAQATRYERWVRFHLTRNDYNPSCAVGELLLIQAETLPTAYVDMLVSVTQEAIGQINAESAVGDPWVYNRTPVTRRRITLRYFSRSDPDTGDDPAERAARRVLLERPMAGRWPCLIIPYSFDRRMVIYGSAKESLTTEFDKNESKRRLEVEVREYPIPGLHHTLGTV
jgi:hypothetical protein